MVGPTGRHGEKHFSYFFSTSSKFYQGDMAKRHVPEKSGLLSFLSIYWFSSPISFLSIYWYNPLPPLRSRYRYWTEVCWPPLQYLGTCNLIISDLYLHLPYTKGIKVQQGRTKSVLELVHRCQGLLEVLNWPLVARITGNRCLCDSSPPGDGQPAFTTWNTLKC